MPQRDSIHDMVKQALIKDGWEITDDPFVMTYGERFLFVDLGAAESPLPHHQEGRFIGAQRAGRRIAVEIKDFRGKSVLVDLEQAIGQYVLYRLILNRVEPERGLYLAITDIMFDDIFQEPIGELVITDLPLQLVIVNTETQEVQQWIPPKDIERSFDKPS